MRRRSSSNENNGVKRNVLSTLINNNLLLSAYRSGKARGGCSQRALFKIVKENLHYRDRTLGSHREQEWPHWQRRELQLRLMAFFGGFCRLLISGCSPFIFPPPDYRSVSDAAESAQQTKRSQQSPFPFPPGGRRDHGQVWRRGQPASATRETHQPSEDTCAWVRPASQSAAQQFSLFACFQGFNIRDICKNTGDPLS